MGAGGAGILVMALVTGEAAQALVHADAGAIVAGPDLEGVVGGVTLVAGRLARVGRDSDRPLAIHHLWQGQRFGAEKELFPAIVEAQ